MKIFVAKNDEELGICLRMLYPEKREVVVIPVLNERKKMEFHIKSDDMDDATFNRYQQRFDLLIGEITVFNQGGKDGKREKRICCMGKKA